MSPIIYSELIGRLYENFVFFVKSTKSGQGATIVHKAWKSQKKKKLDRFFLTGSKRLSQLLDLILLNKYVHSLQEYITMSPAAISCFVFKSS